MLFKVTTIKSLLITLTEGELIEDPDDRVANFLMGLSQHLSVGAKRFAAIYLLGHGAVKILLVVALLREKRWAFPVGIAVIMAFIGYQSYRLSRHFSVALLILTLFDVIVVMFVWLE